MNNEEDQKVTYTDEEIVEYLKENELWNEYYGITTNAQNNGFSWDKDLFKWIAL